MRFLVARQSLDGYIGCPCCIVLRVLSRNLILFTSSANDDNLSPSNKNTSIIGGRRSFKVGGQERALGPCPKWGQTTKSWWGLGQTPQEADDTFVKTCYFVMVLRMT